MQPSLQVRRLSATDSAAYYALRWHALDEPVAIEPQVRRELEAGGEGIGTQLAEYVANRTGVWGAFDGDALVGTAALSREYHLSYGDIGVLWGVFVLPRYRGTPVSRLLMDTVLGVCIMDSTIGQILAPCAVDNVAGFRFLQRFGFELMSLPIRDGLTHGQDVTFNYLWRPVLRSNSG